MMLFKKNTNKRTRSTVASATSAQKSNFPYYQNRANDTTRLRRDITTNQSHGVKRKRRHLLNHIPALLLCVVVLSSLLYLSTVDVNAKVIMLNGDTKDSTISLREETVYQNAAQQFLSQSLVNRSKFLVDVNGLSDHMRKEFPELAAASVTIPIMGRRPVIELQTTKPAFILTTGKSSMLIGNNGVALIDSRDAKNGGKFSIRTVNDESGLELMAGKAALPEEQTQFISVVVEQLEKQSFTVDMLTIPRSIYDLHVRLRGKTYYIKFNVNEDPLQQVGAYIATSKQFDSEIKEYIDVRVGDRVFYK